MNIEEWRIIKDFPDYEISSHGRLRRVTKYRSTWPGRILRQSNNVHGYPCASLCRNGKKKTIVIHKLVAEAFLGDRPNGSEVNHIDGNKRNNHISNFEYVTSSGNAVHAISSGLRHDFNYGERAKSSKLKNSDIIEMFRLKKEGKTVRQIAELFPVKVRHIRRILSGERWGWLQIEATL